MWRQAVNCKVRITNSKQIPMNKFSKNLKQRKTLNCAVRDWLPMSMFGSLGFENCLRFEIW